LTRYIGRRAVFAIGVIAGVVILTFLVARVVPGDPAVAWAGPHAPPSEIAHVREQLGLDRPVPVQVIKFFEGVVTGNWGTSIHTHRPVLSDMRKAAPASLELVVAALLIAVALGVPLGLISAARPGRPLDHVIRIGSILGVSMPIFWMALIFQMLFFQRLHLLPVAGEYDPNVAFAHPLHTYTGMGVIDSLLSGNWPMLESSVSHLLLPALVVASYPVGVIARMVRASVLDTLGETHVQMVRALGFSERSVFARFAMKLAWNPVAAVIALVFAYSLVNTFLVESIFDWPGLGSYAAASIASLDTPAIVGVTLFIAIIYVVANLVVDVVQALLDPRIRLQ
jgi:peptide/nickel transport system permease protein